VRYALSDGFTRRLRRSRSGFPFNALISGDIDRHRLSKPGSARAGPTRHIGRRTGSTSPLLIEHDMREGA
jgi:hypothetical protein